MEDPLLPKSTPKTSDGGTIVNIFKCVTGTGILALPYAIALGRFSSVVILLCFGLLCTYTALKLSEAAKKGPPYKDFEELGSASGPVAAQAMFFVQTLELGGVTIVFLILCASAASALPLFANIPSVVAVIISGVLATVIVCFCPNMSNVAWVSRMGAVNIVLTFFIVLFDALSAPDWSTNISFLWHVPSMQDLLIVVGCIMFTFTAHGNFPILVYEMRNPENSSKCFLTAFMYSIVFQVAFALLGFITYGISVNQSVNTSVRNSTFRTILSCSIFWDKMLTYPVVYVPLEQNIAKMAKMQPRTVRPLLSALIIAVAGLLGNDFVNVMSLVGNIACSLDAFVFPVIFFATLCVMRKWEYVSFTICVAVGLMAMIGGSGADITHMIKNLADSPYKQEGLKQ